MTNPVPVAIISGGQTGVDQAALRAAKRADLVVGGTMPKGWMTSDGPRPEFARLYDMVECEEPKQGPEYFRSNAVYWAAAYRARTIKNVADSDLTLWYGPTGSRGYHLTRKTTLDKRGVDRFIEFVMGPPDELDVIVNRIMPLLSPEVTVINCAGSRESSYPGIGEKAEIVFYSLFTLLAARLTSPDP